MAVDVVALIKDVGFPIFVTMWVLRTMERRLDKISEILANLTTAMTVLAKSVDTVDRNVDAIHDDITGSHSLMDEEHPRPSLAKGDKR